MLGDGDEGHELQTVHLGIPLRFLLAAMIVPAICARHCRKGCLGSDSLLPDLAPAITLAFLPVPFVLLSQEAGFSHPLALPASSSHMFIIVSSVTFLAPSLKGLFLLYILGASDITLTQHPRTAQPQKDLDHGSYLFYKGESSKIAAMHAEGERPPAIMMET